MWLERKRGYYVYRTQNGTIFLEKKYKRGKTGSLIKISAYRRRHGKNETLKILVKPRLFYSCREYLRGPATLLATIRKIISRAGIQRRSLHEFQGRSLLSTEVFLKELPVTLKLLWNRPFPYAPFYGKRHPSILQNLADSSLKILCQWL